MHIGNSTGFVSVTRLINLLQKGIFWPIFHHASCDSPLHLGFVYHFSQVRVLENSIEVVKLRSGDLSGRMVEFICPQGNCEKVAHRSTISRKSY